MDGFRGEMTEIREIKERLDAIERRLNFFGEWLQMVNELLRPTAAVVFSDLKKLGEARSK